MKDTPYFAHPSIYCEVNSGILGAIRKEWPNQTRQTEWRLGQTLEDLGPLMALHTIAFPLFARRQIRGLVYDIDTQDVRPGNSQRPEGWHQDATARLISGREFKLLVADDPTEFLVVNRNRGNTSQKKGRRNNLQPHQLESGVVPDDQLADYGLSVFKPKPFALVALEGQMHRSPLNTSTKWRQRTWIRIDGL